jgi:DNA-binding NarL/FixJ family response regulator
VTVRVLLVDDEELVRTGLRVIIEASGDLQVVGEAADGVGVVQAIREVRPDVVILDVRMPLMDGIQATREILRSFPEPPKILVLTTLENDEYVYAALRAGANGLLFKRSSPAEIAHAVRLVASGESLLFPAAVRALAGRHGGAPTQPPARHAGLTEREAEVLRLMAKGLSNAEIADQLVLGQQTVKTHVSSVLAKLHARDRTQAVIFAYESGFIPLR